MLIFFGLDCSRNLFPSSMVAFMVVDLCNFFYSASAASFGSWSTKLWPSLMVSAMVLVPLIFFLLLYVWWAASILSDFLLSADFLPLFLAEPSFFAADFSLLEADLCD
jgi:hypothetical protein